STNPYVFTYTYTDCAVLPGTNTQEFSIIVTDDISSNFPSTDVEKDICKDDAPTREYDLLIDGLGLNIPLNTGRWDIAPDDQPAGMDVDPSSGRINVKDLKAGPYTFTFTSSSSATGVCFDPNNPQSATLVLNIGDIGSGANDGRIQLCIDEIRNNPSTAFDLNHYVATDLDLVWHEVDGSSEIGTSVNHGGLTGGNGVTTYAYFDALGVGTHKLNFLYESTGCSGNGEGSLYVTVTDELDVNNATVQYCRPDMPTDLNLSQLLGVSSVNANWALTSIEDKDGNAVTRGTVTDYTDGDPTFSENGTYTDEYTYVFTYTPGAVNACGFDSPVTLTIKVKQDSFD
ncbi:MAG: hypothetical protein MI866_13660, partial [Bacteroidales bacterium]|nr:hypothetical protein [Bacteroidales bacterium]